MEVYNTTVIDESAGLNIYDKIAFAKRKGSVTVEGYIDCYNPKPIYNLNSDNLSRPSVLECIFSINSIPYPEEGVLLWTLPPNLKVDFILPKESPGVVLAIRYALASYGMLYNPSIEPRTRLFTIPSYTTFPVTGGSRYFSHSAKISIAKYLAKEIRGCEISWDSRDQMLEIIRMKSDWIVMDKFNSTFLSLDVKSFAEYMDSIIVWL